MAIEGWSQVNQSQNGNLIPKRENITELNGR
jgi:hypothetical protein